MTTLVIVEHEAGKVKASTLNTVTAAQKIGGPVHLLVAGHQAAPVAESAAKIAGVEKVRLVEAPQYEHALAENLAALVVALAPDSSHILAPATTFGKNFLPRVAALLDLTALTPWADRKPGQLGRSWQQRVGLARALGLQPEVLLLDSPLTGLDARETAWWLDVLGQLSRGHDFMGGRCVTLVVTADDLRPWRRHADRVAYLANRRLRVLGDWRAVADCKEAVLRELLPDGSPGD